MKLPTTDSIWTAGVAVITVLLLAAFTVFAVIGFIKAPLLGLAIIGSLALIAGLCYGAAIIYENRN